MGKLRPGAEIDPREAAMARHVLLVLSNATAGCDDEFNDWYTNEHLRDVLSVDGFVAAQRFRLSDAQLQPDRPASHRYLAVYEIEADDPGAPLQALLSGVTTGAIPLSEALDLGSLAAFAWTPITGRVTS
jgi:alkylhydroperoxidase family enzyme